MMGNRKSTQQRIDESFVKELREIQVMRRSNVDKNKTREISFERITRGIPKDPLWKAIKKELIRKPREEDLDE